MSSHLVVRDWPPDLAMKDIEFNLSPFWIQIYGLPLNQITKSNAEKIVEKIRVLQENDFTANGRISWCKIPPNQSGNRYSLNNSFGLQLEQGDKPKIVDPSSIRKASQLLLQLWKIGACKQKLSSPLIPKPEHMTSPYGPWPCADHTVPFLPEGAWNPLTITIDKPQNPAH
ncbi:hypothetical protein RJ639_005458 [Escallonia herrerae]|uniref:DUF4283 domain-containing protein n=1 Tax=Escallonia herrerae TaxID=1293975 RepID=A0AA89AYJ3_9ASTE|nr:hypothetical protein RJ639_005458 [Escallonia herrerae]